MKKLRNLSTFMRIPQEWLRVLNTLLANDIAEDTAVRLLRENQHRR